MTPHGVESLEEAVERALVEDREAALRDVFACSAMAATVAREGSINDESTAREAYAMADAMLKVRRL